MLAIIARAARLASKRLANQNVLHLICLFSGTGPRDLRVILVIVSMRLAAE